MKTIMAESCLEPRSDTELVGAVCQGDKSAYAVLVRRHYKHVFLACLGILGNVHDAEDMAQDAMITGYEKIRQLRTPARYASWVVRIGRNLSINFLRKRMVAERALDEKRNEPIFAEGDDGRLQRAVAQLPRDLRTPLVMYYFDGRSVKTVAETLDISPSGVYVKLRTAIRELHDMLTSSGDEL